MKRGATNPGATNGEAESHSGAPTLVVIGYGNPYRRDDGAGRLLAAKLVECWSDQAVDARLLTGTQLLPEMAADIAECAAQAVIFVDAAVEASTQVSASNAGPAVQITPVVVDVVSPTLGHSLDPATLLLYVDLLYGHSTRAWLVSVPGVDFAHGEGVSEQVERLLDEAPLLAAQLLAAIRGAEEPRAGEVTEVAGNAGILPASGALAGEIR